uniref:RAP1 GTPase activating protein 2a n=1 Tax=Hucho hucho TaxID=62062 RepID=A0A4W5Q3C7_9TELE
MLLMSAEFFDMLERMQDDYIPYPRIEDILEKGSPYPQVILPQFGGYWIEDAEAPAGTPTSSESSFCEEDDGGGMSPAGGFGFRLECNSTARAYRKHFLGREHMNYYCTGSSLGNLIMSLKHEEAEGQEFLRIILRSRTKTHHDRISLAGLNQLPSVPQIAKLLCDDVTGLKFNPVLYPRVSLLHSFFSARRFHLYYSSHRTRVVFIKSCHRNINNFLAILFLCGMQHFFSKRFPMEHKCFLSDKSR